MSYRRVAPPAALRDDVDFFWCLEGQLDAGARSAFTVMPNGQPGLIFQQSPQAFTGFDGGRLPQLFVFGQPTGFGQLCATGSYCQVGVSFHPAALRSLFGLAASELTDAHFSLSELLRRTSLTGRLLECRGVEEQFACLARFLMGLKRTGDHLENAKAGFAAGALREGRELSFVQRELGISERSLERLFLGHIGLTPILYSRISRFQNAMARLKQGAYSSLTDVAYSSGYFDQSHFIRDFRRFSGVSPRVYLRKSVERMPGFPEWEV